MLKVIIGPMYSGKSTTLIANIERKKLSKKRCIILNNELDERYMNINNTNDFYVCSHSGLSLEAIKSNSIIDTINKINIDDYDVIGIDEGQFFKDLVEGVIALMKLKKEIYVCGLNGDSNAKKFGDMLDLICYANQVEYLTAVCTICGEDAPFSYCVSTKQQQTDIQALYEARCFQHIN